MGLERKLLPSKAKGKEYEVLLGGQKLYVRTLEYEDGRLGEIFIDAHNSAEMRSLLGCFALSVSLGLQHEVPLEDYVEFFVSTRSKQQGQVSGDPDIKSATSILDYVFRRLGADYLGRKDLLQSCK
ncbi:MAG: hypothetical protein HY363_05575 [Candidatus Aenigmarchaeota archaeon]|nr:hypothetical protein [Candidatus Aenigmarchaeota archaeon]